MESRCLHLCLKQVKILAQVIILETLFLATTHDTLYYKEACQLRDVILRKPLGMSLYDQNLEEEKNFIHIIGKSKEGHIIAYLQFKAIDESTTKMQQVAVHSEYQNQGIGRNLVIFSETFAKKEDFSQIILHAREPVIGFYERLGYTKVGDRFHEVGIPHYKMEKNIEPNNIN